MKILVLLPRIPWPLEKGDKLRAYNQIKQLAQNNELILCAINTDKNIDEEDARNALKHYCNSIHFFNVGKMSILTNLVKAFLNGLPMQCGYFYNKRIHKEIRKLIEQHNPDMLFGQLLRVAEYIRYEKTPKTIDYQDVFSMGMKRRAEIASCYMRPFFNMEYRRLRRYEREIFDDFDVKTIISNQDRDDIDHPNRDEILIVPNGVDHEYYTPQERTKKYDIVFTGNMAYAPNVNAVEYLADEILPLVWKKLPETNIYIAGATPDPRVKKVASDKIIISGWLDDMRDAYAQSRIFIAPMRIGTGLQNKLLEAMSMRLPCITTSLANNSLHAEDNKEILVGNNAEELANNIITLLTDKEKAEAVAQNGYDFVHRVYDWGEATKIMENEMKLIIK